MHALIWYTLAAVIVWLPVFKAMPSQNRLEQILGGLLVALAWPLTVPALLFGLSRPERVVTTR